MGVSLVVDPNEAPTEVAPSIPAMEEGETHSIPETPHMEPEQGALPPVDEAVGIATRIEGKEVIQSDETAHSLAIPASMPPPTSGRGWKRRSSKSGACCYSKGTQSQDVSCDVGQTDS